MKTRIFIVRLNVIEPLGASAAEAEVQLIKSLNQKGVELLAEIPFSKLGAVKAVIER
jgi:hypothetical protein